MNYSTVSFEARDREFVLAVVRKFLRDDSRVEDVTQEALLLAFRFKSSFRGECAYHTWLYRVTWTTVLRELRSRRRGAFVDMASVGASRLVAHEPTPRDQLIEREDRLACSRVLSKIPVRQREVLVLRLDHSVAETARALGVTVANVKVRAHRARAELRRKIGELAA